MTHTLRCASCHRDLPLWAFTRHEVGRMRTRCTTCVAAETLPRMARNLRNMIADLEDRIADYRATAGPR